ncbi:hypothetical protein Pmani_004688 [Petrolisthes manimaculis]|uniref:FAD/NAD(P)-binding domain-containing protein n=1 Tax=Petrolisthes manimaculis TaxID=1843537 RepID=A0AAE1QFG5_9EUCA|nr:hypothetical protein Pmani_004688 [Petrolisthes manimaculis]
MRMRLKDAAGRNTHTHTHTQRPKTLAVFERAGSEVTDKVTLFRSVADFQQLHEVAGKGGHITIIGGGFLGSELACALGYKTKSTKGSVTQVYPEYGNMAKVLPEYLSRWTTDKVKSEGVDIITHSTVKDVTTTPDGKLKLSFDTGKEVGFIYTFSLVYTL